MSGNSYWAKEITTLNQLNSDLNVFIEIADNKLLINPHLHSLYEEKKRATNLELTNYFNNLIDIAKNSFSEITKDTNPINKYEKYVVFKREVKILGNSLKNLKSPFISSTNDYKDIKQIYRHTKELLNNIKNEKNWCFFEKEINELNKLNTDFDDNIELKNNQLSIKEGQSYTHSFWKRNLAENPELLACYFDKLIDIAEKCFTEIKKENEQINPINNYEKYSTFKRRVKILCYYLKELKNLQTHDLNQLIDKKINPHEFENNEKNRNQHKRTNSLNECTSIDIIKNCTGVRKRTDSLNGLKNVGISDIKKQFNNSSTLNIFKIKINKEIKNYEELHKKSENFLKRVQNYKEKYIVPELSTRPSKNMQYNERTKLNRISLYGSKRVQIIEIQNAALRAHSLAVVLKSEEESKSFISKFFTDNRQQTTHKEAFQRFVGQLFRRPIICEEAVEAFETIIDNTIELPLELPLESARLGSSCIKVLIPYIQNPNTKNRKSLDELTANNTIKKAFSEFLDDKKIIDEAIEETNTKKNTSYISGIIPDEERIVEKFIKKCEKICKRLKYAPIIDLEFLKIEYNLFRTTLINHLIQERSPTQNRKFSLKPNLMIPKLSKQHPFITPELLDRLIRAAKNSKNASLRIHISDLLAKLPFVSNELKDGFVPIKKDPTYITYKKT